jgi:hypothetical protein
MNDLICISSIVIAIKLSDRTPNSWMWITKPITCSQLLTGTIWSINAKPRSHVKFGLLWLDCDSQIRTKLANLWGIFNRILKNNLFGAWSFWFKKSHFDSRNWVPDVHEKILKMDPSPIWQDFFHHSWALVPSKRDLVVRIQWSQWQWWDGILQVIECLCHLQFKLYRERKKYCVSDVLA